MGLAVESEHQGQGPSQDDYCLKAHLKPAYPSLVYSSRSFTGMLGSVSRRIPDEMQRLDQRLS